MVSQHSHWRTVEEWRLLNVPLSTPSNVASKMYDATLTQLISFHNDPSLGGVSTTLKTMLEADPDFVVGQALNLSLELFSGKLSTKLNPELEDSLQKLERKAEMQPNLSTNERKHVHAIRLQADGFLKEACEVWEDILLDHPFDLLAQKSAYLGYVYLGDSVQLRDSLARILPLWSPSVPLYGFLLGKYAFGLEETNLFDQAEKQAVKALEINGRDAWATHSLSHVFEMTGEQARGIKFLDSTVNNWEGCDMLACHNWWHMALHYIEMGDFEQALEIYEKQVKTRCIKQQDLFNVVDAASLLFRLEMEGVNVVSQWKAIQDVAEPHIGAYTLAFDDLHLMMACLEDKKALEHMLKPLEDFVRNGQGTTHDVHSKVGLRICQALAAYKDGNFALATDLVYPVRHQIFTIGGSYAQRDVFNLFLIVSAIKSSNTKHHRLARALVAERKALKEKSPLTDRLMARVMALEQRLT